MFLLVIVKSDKKLMRYKGLRYICGKASDTNIQYRQEKNNEIIHVQTLHILKQYEWLSEERVI